MDTDMKKDIMNLEKALKEEISRQARKEFKILVAPLEKKIKLLNSRVDELKKRITELEKKKLDKPASYKIPTQKELAAKADEFKFPPERLKRLRQSLKLTQEQMAHIIGTTNQSLYSWEAGKAVPRHKSRLEIVKISELGKRGFKALYKDKLTELENKSQPTANTIQADHT